MMDSEGSHVIKTRSLPDLRRALAERRAKEQKVISEMKRLAKRKRGSEGRPGS